MTILNPDIFLSKREQDAIRKGLGHAGTISEYFSKAAEYLEEGKAGWSDALLKAAPWLTVVAPKAGAVAGAVGIAAKLFDKWTAPKKPYELGAIACTLAWREAARVAIERHVTSVFAYRATKDAAKRVADRIRALPEPEDANLSTFSFEIALIHPFVQRADEMLRILLRSGGVPETEETKIFNTLHEQFKLELQQLLASQETAPKFEPFTKLVVRGVNEEMRTLQALHIHAEYQRTQFVARPLFGQEPFSLRDVYLDTECGELTWGQISPVYNKQMGGRFADSGGSAQFCVDPFSEFDGGRTDLLQTALRLIADGPVDEPIVIQGYAGQGKSSFTLRLCAALMEPEQGFIPIRVRLKKLRLEGSLLESLVRAVEFCDDAQSRLFAYLNGFQLMRTIFNTPHGKYTHLSRYVLLLDGWDEMEISANEGFRAKVHRVLEQVRREFLSGTYGCNVRVIVTGRPNPDVETSALLQERTPVLTLRNLRPEQLHEFVGKLKTITSRPPVPAGDKIQEDAWEAPDPAVFSEVFEQYKIAFEQAAEQGDGKLESHMEVLGLPLLAYLTVRVMSEMAAQHEGLEAQQAALSKLVWQPTQLYRCLTDLTCEKAGKAPFSDTKKDEDLKMARELGKDLRRKLHYTAAAITAIGQEHISKVEWQRRLPKEMTRENLTSGRTPEDDSFVKLVISFYFKGGHQDQGIEFAHKSFREYLFAEHIVETLKELGGGLSPDMPRRAKHWLNFSREDARHKLAQTLGKLFAPQWLSLEVCRHLEELLRWEITRDHARVGQQQPDIVTRFGLQTDKADFLTWEAIRDALADLWEWWTDGVHLRPVVEQSDDDDVREVRPPIAHFWIMKVCAKDNAADGEQGMESITSVDAHVGEALFRLCCLMHYFIAVAGGWNGSWQEEIASAQEKKPFQTLIGGKGRKWRLFRLSETREESCDSRFTHWSARINAAFDRHIWPFPSQSPMNGVDLRGAILDRATFFGAGLAYARLDGARLNAAYLFLANLNGASLNRAYLHDADLNYANLDGASLNHANLDGASLDNTSLKGASLDGASLDGVSLNEASLEGASLKGASLEGASLKGASLGEDRRNRITDLSNAFGLTLKQLRTIGHLTKGTLFPPGEEFEQLKQLLLRQQREQASRRRRRVNRQ